MDKSMVYSFWLTL